MSGGFFRGTSAEQDTRFSNKQAKLLKTQKFAPELEHLVDIAKVKMDVVRPWIAKRVTELLGFEDEVLINFIYGLLEGKDINGKGVQIQLTGFMEKHTGKFMKELWSLLLSAQNNASGVPQQFLDAKEEETRKKKEELDRIGNEMQKRREKGSREFEQVNSKMDGVVDDSTVDPNSKHVLAKDSQVYSDDDKEAGARNGYRGRSRASKSPQSADKRLSPRRAASRSPSKSYSNSRSYSQERNRSRNMSRSPPSRRHSVSSEARSRSPKRSISPIRQRSSLESLSPRRRSPPKRRSTSRSRYRSPSPARRRVRSPSPGRRRSRSPARRRVRSPSPWRRRSPALRRRRSPSWRRRSRSPRRRRSPSPWRRRSPSPRRRRSPSPVKRHRRRSPSSSPSPVRRRSPPSRRRSPSPLRRRSPSPLRRRSPSPSRRRSPSPSRRRSPSPSRRRSPSPRPRRRSPSPPPRRRSPSPPPRRRSPSPPPRRRSPPRHRSPAPLSRRSPPSRRRSFSPSKSRSPSPSRARSLSPLSGSPAKQRVPVSTHPRSPNQVNRSSSPHSPLSPSPVRRRSRSSSERELPTLKTASLHPPEKIPRSHNESSPSYHQTSKKRNLTSDETHKGRETASRMNSKSPHSKEQSRSEGREDNEYKSMSSQKSVHSPKWNSKDIPEKSSGEHHYGDIDLRKKDIEVKSGREKMLTKEATAVSSSREKPPVLSPRDDVKEGEEALKLTRKDKVNSPIVEYAGSDGSDKHRDTSTKKRKHRKSSRHEVGSDSSSDDSEVEDRKEAKRRRKEEKKLRKEERRRRREERRRRKGEKRAHKRRSKDSDTLSSDSDTHGNDVNPSVARKEAYSSHEDTEMEKKRLENELREKAIQKLRAKKGMSQ